MVDIAVTDQKITGWMNENRTELTSFAVRKYDGNSFMQSFALAVLENPDLRSCLTTDAGKISLRNAGRRAASLGLSLNPQEGKACLVPYNGKIQYQVMKEGYVDLLLDSGNVKYVKIGTVYENDGWEVSETNHGDEYKLSPARKERGKIDLFFAAATLADGTCILRTLTEDQAKLHRTTYSQHSKLGEKEYGEKTIAKMLCRSAKVARLAPVIEIAAEKDESELRDVSPEPDSHGTSPAELAQKIDEAEKPTVVGESAKSGDDGQMDIF